MDMTDVDFEMKYETGRDEADPLDFLSRHPLPIIGNNSTEKILKAAIETKHAVVLDRIKDETYRDTALQKLSTTIKKGNWETSKKDVDLAPFYPIRDELYEAQGLIFRMERIVLPTTLQQKIIKTAMIAKSPHNTVDRSPSNHQLFRKNHGKKFQLTLEVLTLMVTTIW